jgi:hypothetical protein
VCDEERVTGGKGCGGEGRRTEAAGEEHNLDSFYMYSILILPQNNVSYTVAHLVDAGFPHVDGRVLEEEVRVRVARDLFVPLGANDVLFILDYDYP